MLNSLLSQTHHVDADSLRSMLYLFVERWKSATTQEERGIIEGQAILLVGQLLDGTLQLPEVKAGTHPLLTDWLSVTGTQEGWARSSLGKIVRLSELYLRYYNEQKTNELQLLGLIRRIHQKQAAMKLWTSEDIKYFAAEHFLNLEGIKSGNLLVDTSQGIALLPVRRAMDVAINSLAIASGSNGFLGNSDVKVSGNTRLLLNALDSKSDTWFEYERLDNGPVKLNLLVKLDRTQVINHISLKAVSRGFTVEDCLINGTAGKPVSIKTLTDDWNGTVTKLGQDMVWGVHFLPTLAESLTLQLVSNESSPVLVATRDSRTVSRQRYSIGIQQISLQCIEYESEGVLESRSVSVPGTMLVCEGQSQSFPRTDLFHRIDAEYSEDGKSWQPLAQTLLLSGSEKLFWRLKVHRNTDVFKKQVSFSPNLLSEEVESTLRTVSRFQSPARISLSGKVPNGKPICFQPKLLRRGDAKDALDLGTGTGTQIIMPLPLSITEYGVDLDQVHIYVNGLEWEQVGSQDNLGSGFWAISDDMTGIVFDGALPSGAKVKMVLEPEPLALTEGQDGYYAELELPFDPDQSTIVIETTPREATRKNALVSRGLKTINLQTKNLLSEEFTLTSRDGTTYTEVTNRSELAANTYYVDYKNGVLHLFDSIIDDQVRVSFKHHERKRVGTSKIWYRDGVPVGIVLPRTVQLINGSDVVGLSNRQRVNRRGRPAVVTNRFVGSMTAKQLSHENVVAGTVLVTNLFSDTTVKPKEISYQDGHSEFLGLVPIVNEETSEIVSAGTTVQFTLTAGALVWLDTGVSFSDATVFATLVGSVGAVNGTGKYYIAPTTGVVTVWAGAFGTLPAGIQINYLYKNGAFDPTNTYSVDYKRGTVYSGSGMLSTGVIEYKAADVLCSYDVAVPLQATYDGRSNTLEVRTDTLNPHNSLVKTMWIKDTGLPTMESLAPYYSPLVTKLEFRFQ